MTWISQPAVAVELRAGSCWQRQCNGLVERIRCRHRVLQEAKKEDMRVIWEVVGDVELVQDLGNENFEKRNGEAPWIRLVQVMDMSEDELVKDIEKG